MFISIFYVCGVVQYHKMAISFKKVNEVAPSSECDYN